MINRMFSDGQPLSDDFKPFAGRWVAIINHQIVGHGGTPKQALRAAKEARFKEDPEVIFIPMQTPLKFPELFYRIRELLPQDEEIYLVGGAIRDMLLQRPVHDLDFALKRNTTKFARDVANAIGGAIFTLDEKRETVRIIYTDKQGDRIILDFNSLRGKDIEDDLGKRDFTINAMAVDIRNPMQLIDPLGGAQDLLNKRLWYCSPSAFIEDPIRSIRAVRFAANLDVFIQKELRTAIRRTVKRLSDVSGERIRDEIFTIFMGRKVALAIRALDILGCMKVIFPELERLKTIEQSSPYISTLWTHSVETIAKLEGLLDSLELVRKPESSENLIYGLVCQKLGQFRQQINQHLSKELVLGRNIRALLNFAALLHEMGEEAKEKIDEPGDVPLLGPDKKMVEIIEKRGRALRLSNDEIKWVRTIGSYNLHPLFMKPGDTQPSNRAIYRFFRKTGEAGIDICLLSLADTLATYGTSLPQDIWEKQLELVRTLFITWWKDRDNLVSPPPIISGVDLINEFDMYPGPRIGQLLEMVREAQVMGEVTTKENALLYIKKKIGERG
ncbi:MAG: CCA tRNA nucleotidyltransferase [Anaerolineales bacterium]|nr:CCA tRNA nucleotidyltransferase [Anaerolineales bacterium]